MSKVWLVEQGIYSDYRVVGVFSTYENAKQVADFINDGEQLDDAEVVERTLDPYLDMINEGYEMYYVRMGADGSVYECSRDRNDLAFTYHCRLIVSLRNTVVGGVLAKDTTHAVKIANEFRARKIANNEIGEEF